MLAEIVVTDAGSQILLFLVGFLPSARSLPPGCRQQLSAYRKEEYLCIFDICVYIYIYVHIYHTYIYIYIYIYIHECRLYRWNHFFRIVSSLPGHDDVTCCEHGSEKLGKYLFPVSTFSSKSRSSMTLSALVSSIRVFQKDTHPCRWDNSCSG